MDVQEELDINEQDDQELYEHHRIIVDKGQSPLRIDKFLMNRLESTSRNRIQNAAALDCILVNGNPVKPNYKVRPRDTISIVLPKPYREIELIPENIPLEIVYEDEHLVIVNKPAGMVVHPAYGNYTGTLVNALIYHFNELKENFDTKSATEARPGLVHRIDKNTSGLMVIGKNEQAMTLLAKEFFERTIKRKYLALVWGTVKEDSGTISGNVGRSLKDRKVMAVFPEGDHGKHAVTHYKVIERLHYLTLLECRLETGRTHQIRVHMKYLGHPLFNDETYGGDKILKGTTFTKYKQFVENCFTILPRHALHAASLGFIHPHSKEEIYFECPLPSDFSDLLDKWRSYSTRNR